MAIGGGLIWTGVLGAFLFATRADRRAWSQHAAARLILWAGVAFPVLALAALLTYALWLMPSLRPWTDRRADEAEHRGDGPAVLVGGAVPPGGR